MHMQHADHPPTIRACTCAPNPNRREPGKKEREEGSRAELHAGLLDIEARRRAAGGGCGCGCGCAIGWSTERAQGGRVGSAKPVGTGTARRARTLEGDSRVPLPPARTLAEPVAESWQRSVALCTGCPSTLSAAGPPPQAARGGIDKSAGGGGAGDILPGEELEVRLVRSLQEALVSHVPGWHGLRRQERAARVPSGQRENMVAKRRPMTQKGAPEVTMGGGPVRAFSILLRSSHHTQGKASTDREPSGGACLCERCGSPFWPSRFLPTVCFPST